MPLQVRGFEHQGAPLARRRRRLGDRDRVTWKEVAQVPLCLLTPDMQNRRIIDGLLRSAGGDPHPTLESDSMILLFAHVRTGRWASVMPARLAESMRGMSRPLPVAEISRAALASGVLVPMPTEPGVWASAVVVSSRAGKAR